MSKSPQARLPDVNTAFITYRREAIVSIKSYDHRSCYGALSCINSLLPEKYRIKLDTMQFNEESKTDFIYCCIHCTRQTAQSKIDIFDYVLDSCEILLTDEKTIKMWKCPECCELNKLSDTIVIKDMLAQPSFLHTIPLAPERKNGLLGRSKYRKDFSKWAWNFLYELEERMAQFRDDNWSKDQEYQGPDDVDTSEEEEGEE